MGRFLPALNPASPVPLYRQLYEAYREAILSGQLLPGEKLPTTRELAAKLGINRTTVNAALKLLKEEGLVEAEVGRGSFIRRALNHEDQQSFPWELVLARNSSSWVHPSVPVGAQTPINLATTQPGFIQETDRFLAVAFEQLIKRRNWLRELVDNTNPAGYPPLLELLYQRAARYGIAKSKDGIVVTSGSQQALDLLCRALAGADSTIVVEDPVAPGVQNVFRSMGVKVAGLPVNRWGWDLERLDQLLKQSKIAAIVLTPDLQNPTGATMSLAQRQQVLQLTARYPVVVIEHAPYCWLGSERNGIPGLKQLDETGQTVRVESVSKAGLGSLRLGWIIGPSPLIERLVELKQWSDLYSSPIIQALFYWMLSTGQFDAYVPGVRQEIERRYQTAVEAVKKWLGGTLLFTRAHCSTHLWLELPQPCHAQAIALQAQLEGVSVLAGSYFSVEQPLDRMIRLGLGMATVEQIGKGIEIIGRIVRQAACRENVRSERAFALV